MIDLRTVSRSAEGTSTADKVGVRVIRSVPGLDGIRSTWTSWQYYLDSNVDLYTAELRSRPHILRPHVIVLNQDEHPACLLIGRIEETRINFNIGYLRLSKPQVRMLTFVYNGLLGDQSPRSSEVLVGEVMNALRRGEADLAWFRYLRTDSSLYGVVTRASTALTRDHFPRPQTHRRMILSNSVEEFYRGMSAKTRQTQRWKAKKFLRDHSDDLRVDCFGQAAELERVLPDVEEVAKKSYQRGLGVGFVDSAEMRQRLQFEAEKGWLRIYILYAANRPCAFWIGTVYHEIFHSRFLGYDPHYANYSPGMFLILRVIESLWNQPGIERVKELDFGIGDAQYKDLLSNHEWQEASVYIFAPTPKGFRLNVLNTLTTLFDHLAKRALERTGLLPRVKKIWRNRVRHESRDAR